MQKPGLICIVKATMIEAKPFISRLGLDLIANSPFRIFANKEIMVIISGIGKANGAMATYHACREYSPKRVLNLGAAGAVAPGMAVGDIYHITKIVEPDRPDFRTNGPHSYAPETIKGFDTAVIATQDHAVISLEERQQVAQLAQLVDMEAAGVAQACRKFKVPCMVFKYVTDTVEAPAEETIMENIRLCRDAAADFFQDRILPRLM